MTVDAATVDLARTSQVWHILRDAETSVCNFAIPADAVVERGVDVHVVKHRAYMVCSRCRGTARKRTGGRL